jgi:hypothetical protein
MVSIRGWVINRLASIPSALAPLAMIRPGLDPLQRALGDDDGDLINLGGHLTALLSGCGSDAAARLGNSSDLRRCLGGAFREQLVELLARGAGGLAKHPDGGPGAFGLVLVAHELDDLPVPAGQLTDAFGRGDLRRHVFAPLRGIGEESLVVDGYFGASPRC